MFCNNCGKELLKSARFCDNCGTYVSDINDGDRTGRPITASEHQSEWNWDNSNKNQGAGTAPESHQNPPPNNNRQNPPPNNNWQNPPPNNNWQNPPPNNNWQNPPPNNNWHKAPPNYGYNAVDDNPAGWAVLGFIMAIFLTPIIGLILYLVWKDSYPNKAAAVGKGTLTAVITGVALFVILMIFVVGMGTCMATAYSFLPLM